MSERYKQSDLNFQEAVKYIPGGVNSPVRAFKSVDLNPVFVKQGVGCRITDVDDNEYIDYIGSWGPLILGHAHPAVMKAVWEAAQLGTSFGLPTTKETELAQLVTTLVPSIEQVRMVNSGTEATMSALRLARAYTKRNKILKFEGCYHGHSDSLLIKAGSGVATLGLPDSPGVPENTGNHTLTVPYNDLESVRIAFQKFGHDIAAIIVEPVAGNMGVVPPEPDFLPGLRQLADHYGALLIFDEVMTGFRVDYHCAQGKFGITPDLTTLGKVIGGGLPVGAYGGKGEIMDWVAPAGPVYQAGTLSGNPLAMAAGLVTLQEMGKGDVYSYLEKLGDQLAEGIGRNAREVGIPHHINRVGSMVGFFFSEKVVKSYEEAKQSDTRLFARYFKEMMDRGVAIAPSQFEGMFISTAHSEADIEKTITIQREALLAL